MTWKWNNVRRTNVIYLHPPITRWKFSARRLKKSCRRRAMCRWRSTTDENKNLIIFWLARPFPAQSLSVEMSTVNFTTSWSSSRLEVGFCRSCWFLPMYRVCIHSWLRSDRVIWISHFEAISPSMVFQESLPTQTSCSWVIMWIVDTTALKLSLFSLVSRWWKIHVDLGCPFKMLAYWMLIPKVRYPGRITILRGNHESRQITQVLNPLKLSIWKTYRCTGSTTSVFASTAMQMCGNPSQTSLTISPSPHLSTTRSLPCTGVSAQALTLLITSGAIFDALVDSPLLLYN